MHIDTRASDTIRAVDIKGNLDLKGRGDDVELQNVAGLVTVNGVYVGEIQLRNLAQAAALGRSADSLGFEKLPGQIRLARGELTGNNLSARSVSRLGRAMCRFRISRSRWI